MQSSFDPIVSGAPTHQVFNQVPPLEGFSLVQHDLALREVVERNQAAWAMPGIQAYGELLGQKAWIQKGFQANRFSPELHTHDRMGNRMDAVEFHPAYHELMELAMQHRVHCLPWSDPRKGAHTARLALFYLHSQNEAGTCCPLSMTFASVPALQQTPTVTQSWLAKILTNIYDPSNRPIGQKEGATIGMAMTEKQGGTDVRANTTQARQSGNGYELIGHKWFCSAPMSDAFLTLAQTEAGLSCFLVPRWRPDGSKNTMHIQRLKDKLGNRSNASSEIEFHGARGELLGQAGRGISTIIQMVALTRYDCMIGSTALMRRGLTEVIHHIRHRKVMGKFLMDQPLMQNVVADLCLEVEGALAMTARAAAALDHPDREEEQLLLRLLLPIGKYWICKRGIAFLGEAMECLGGNGYVEQSILPRLYREIPVNSIWEGSGNVQCLDVSRAIHKQPAVLDVLMEELGSALGKNDRFDQFLPALKDELTSANLNPYHARSLTERLAKAMQAAQLLKNGDAQVAQAFCLARLGDNQGLNFGTLPQEIDCRHLIDRTFPPQS